MYGYQEVKSCKYRRKPQDKSPQYSRKHIPCSSETIRRIKGPSCVDGPTAPVCACEPSHELALVVDGPGRASAKISTLSSFEAAGDPPSPDPHSAFDTVIEVALPFALLRALPEGDPSGRRATRLSFSIATLREDTLMELLPAAGSIELDLR